MKGSSVVNLMNRLNLTIGHIVKIFIAIVKPDSNSPLHAVDFVFISADENKAEQTRGGQAFDRLLDTLAIKLDNLGFTHVHIARPPALVVGLSAWSDARRINRAFSIRLIADLFIGVFQEDKFRFRRALYSDLFGTLRPKAVFAIGSRGYMWQAAHDLGIPFVEVLHGVGYDDLTTTPTFSRGSTEGFPGFVASFDDVSSSSWVRLIGDEKRLLRVESFWLKEFLGSSSAPELPLFYSPHSRPWREFGRKVLITLSSSVVGASPLFSERDAAKGRPEEILRTIENTEESVFWMIRFHPVMAKTSNPGQRVQRERIRVALSRFRNVEVVESSRTPLPSLLKDATHHITSDSMATYEAAEFGVPSFLISKSLPEIGGSHLSPLIDEGYATLASSSEKTVLEWILSTKPLNPRRALATGMNIEELAKRLSGMTV